MKPIRSAEPVISVITIVRNGMPWIQDCATSVLEQDFAEFEYIIIDGDSTDGCLEYVRSLEFHSIKVFTGSSSGIANAMNEGLLNAAGEWVLFLHADDYLESPKSLSKISKSLKSRADILAFDIWHETLSGRKIRRSPRGFDWYFRFKTGIFHQACLSRRSLLSNLDGFDPRYRITMDYDFFLRAKQHGAQIELKKSTFSVMRLTGVSSKRDWSSMKARFLEEQATHKANAKTIFDHLVYTIYWSLYWPYRRCIYEIRSIFSQSN